MASEGLVQRQIWLALSQVSRLFRLNTGRAWLSNLGPRGVQRLDNGSVLIHAARSIPLGFGSVRGDPIVGACDLPGWTTITITPEMVGKQVAVFTSIETKRSKGGKVSEDQLNWQLQVRKAGGIAAIVNSPESALSEIDHYKTTLSTNM